MTHTQRLGNSSAWCVLSNEDPDPDKCAYRYELGRVWAKSRGLWVFCMLNPSRADHVKADLTITKCTGFVERFGGGGFVVVNAFGLRTPYPRELIEAKDPIGPCNSTHVSEAIAQSVRYGVIAAWGAPPPHHAVAEQIARTERLYMSWQCFGITMTGHPRHPSRLAYSTPLEFLTAARRKGLS